MLWRNSSCPSLPCRSDIPARLAPPLFGFSRIAPHRVGFGEDSDRPEGAGHGEYLAVPSRDGTARYSPCPAPSGRSESSPKPTRCGAMRENPNNGGARRAGMSERHGREGQEELRQSMMSLG